MIPLNQFERLPRVDDPVAVNAWLDSNISRSSVLFLLKHLVTRRFTDSLASLFPYRIAALVREGVISDDDVDEVLMPSTDILVQKIHSEWTQFKRTGGCQR